MKKILFYTLIFLFFGKLSFGQLDSVRQFCKQYIKYPYISDGQQYFALLTEGQTAEFHITFYGGATYRIAGCSAPEEKSLIFRVYDKYHNEIFSNDKFNYATYWDIKFTSTVNCIIEAELPPSKQSGFAILMIGFKQE